MRGRTLALALALVLAPALWAPGLFLSLRAGPSATEARPASVAEGRAPAVPAGSGEVVTFASVRGLDLVVPTRGLRGLGYHEGGMGDGSVPLLPVGRCRPCRAPGFAAPPPEGSELRYSVMASRGRGRHPTSAADLAVGPETPVASPVSGRVLGVERYRLYGRHRDVRVVIRPAEAPEVLVFLLHLRGVLVAPGDRVQAGVTPLGRARPLPFRSQVERYVGGRVPHVHVEVVDARSRPQA